MHALKIAQLILFSIVTSCSFSQVRDYYDEPNYYYFPLADPINNRDLRDCRIACIHQKYQIQKCWKYEFTISNELVIRDSTCSEIIEYHPNGFTYKKTPGRIYTKVGERVVSEMDARCSNDSLELLRGPANKNITMIHPIWPYMNWIGSFDSNGYLQKEIIMRRGFIKYWDPVDGGANEKNEMVIGETGNLLELRIYWSHDRFFGHPKETYFFKYYNNGTLKEEMHIYYEGKKIDQVELFRYFYLKSTDG